MFSHVGRLYETRFVDASRDAEFVGYGIAGAYESVKVALLTWGSKQVPLEFESTSIALGEQGYYSLYSITNLGASPKVTRETGVPAYRFLDDEERATIHLLACEAIIVSASRFITNTDPQFFPRVLSAGRELCLEDFGYSTDANERGGNE